MTHANGPKSVPKSEPHIFGAFLVQDLMSGAQRTLGAFESAPLCGLKNVCWQGASISPARQERTSGEIVGIFP